MLRITSPPYDFHLFLIVAHTDDQRDALKQAVHDHGRIFDPVVYQHILFALAHQQHRHFPGSGVLRQPDECLPTVIINALRLPPGLALDLIVEIQGRKIGGFAVHSGGLPFLFLGFLACFQAACGFRFSE